MNIVRTKGSWRLWLILIASTVISAAGVAFNPAAAFGEEELWTFSEEDEGACEGYTWETWCTCEGVPEASGYTCESCTKTLCVFSPGVECKRECSCKKCTKTGGN